MPCVRGILAAETITEAKEKGDYSAATLKSYRTKMDNSYIMKDINNFQDIGTPSPYRNHAK